jgi:signal transduction histidine kinase
VHRIPAGYLRLLPEPALLVRATGAILAVNAPMEALIGRAAHALAGVTLADVVASPPARVGEYLRLCSRSADPVPGAFDWHTGRGTVGMRCDGGVLVRRTADEPAIVLLRGRVRNDEAQRFALLTNKIEELSHEVLERRKAERERDMLLAREREARLEAERASRLKDHFLATLSHELRTPLHAILGWTQVLLNPATPPEHLRSGLEAIHRGGRAQSQIIDDLLDMSRIVSGNMRLDVQPVMLAEVVRAAVETVRPAADAKRIRLQLTLDPLAGPVRGDPNRLQQVVWNLLSNAIKFTPRDGRVQVFLERVSSRVEITVSDTGEGIAAEFLPHVFERFRQADGSITRVHGGLGLGLSIVRELVALHGGTVQAHSDGAGEGATFIVELPVAVLHAPDGGTLVADDPATDSAGAPAALPRDTLRGLRILVVDDEPDARDLMRALLETLSAAVAVAESVDAGLARLQDFGADLLLCDIGLPGRDGYSMIHEVRSRGDALARVPALALTASARADDRTRALRAGFDGHLAKPVDTGELVATITSLCRRR